MYYIQNIGVIYTHTCQYSNYIKEKRTKFQGNVADCKPRTHFNVVLVKGFPQDLPKVQNTFKFLFLFLEKVQLYQAICYFKIIFSATSKCFFSPLQRYHQSSSDFLCTKSPWWPQSSLLFTLSFFDEPEIPRTKQQFSWLISPNYLLGQVIFIKL